jgi:hypothetical protein
LAEKRTIKGFERPNNLDAVIDDRGVATVMIIRMNKIGREVRGRPVGTRENPGGASKGVKPPEAPWFLGVKIVRSFDIT